MKRGFWPQVGERNNSPAGLLNKFAPASGTLQALYLLPEHTHLFMSSPSFKSLLGRHFLRETSLKGTPLTLTVLTLLDL